MMKNFVKEVILIVCIILIFSGLTLAQEMRLQGKVDEINLKIGQVVVNEKTFMWNSNTKFLDEKGMPTIIDKLRVNTWVYIEGVKAKKGKPNTIQTIYLLPRYIAQGERDQYPFIK
jgi:hypothetical protein